MNIDQLNSRIESLSLQISDINEHIKTLLLYSGQSKSVIEFGVRGIVSTWALLGGRPETMNSYDIVHPSQRGANIDEVYDTAREIGVKYEFICGDILKVEIPESELLFIDTMHCYNQLKQELERHHTKISKYIIFHDTVSFGNNDEFGKEAGCDGQGLLLAINEFIAAHNNWYILEHFQNNNGLMILKNKNFNNDK